MGRESSLNSRRGAENNLAGSENSNRVGKSVFSDHKGVDGTKWQHWQRLVDNKSIGGHFAPVSRELTSALAVPDPGQMDHDARHADQLYKKRPEEPAHPRADDPNPWQLTAFADRAVRLREGRLMRANMMHNDPVESDWGVCKGPCKCQVCNPAKMHAAGVPCHEVCYNKEPPVRRDWPAPVPVWDAEKVQHHSLNSTRVAEVMTHREEVSAPHEEFFKNSLGRKVRASSGASAAGVPSGMLSHRSPFADLSPSAGTYNQERYAIHPESRNLGRQSWQAKAGDEPSRSGVALVLTPHHDDPPPPTKVSSNSKAEGTFKHGYSADAERLAKDRNQEMFRFSDAKSPRGKSLPPPTWDACGYAGQASGAPTHHTHASTGNPLTHFGTNTADLPLTPRRATSAQRSYRTNVGNDSSGLKFLMDHERMEASARQEKTWRMRHDDEFNRLCGHTSQEITSARERAHTTKGTNIASTNVKNQLVWEA